MGDIILPEEQLQKFLQLVLNMVGDKIAAETWANLEAFRARLAAKEALFGAQLEVATERKLRAAEEQIERWTRAMEDKIRAVEEEEIERRRQEQ